MATAQAKLEVAVGLIIVASGVIKASGAHRDARPCHENLSYPLNARETRVQQQRSENNQTASLPKANTESKARIESKGNTIPGGCLTILRKTRPHNYDEHRTAVYPPFRPRLA